MVPKITLEEAIERYGEIKDGVWADEAKWCVLLEVPAELADHWVNSATGGGTHRIYCNRDMAGALAAALQNVIARGFIGGLRTFDGCFQIRTTRGEEYPSSHSYALSIDINAQTNALGQEGDLPDDLARCFTDEGFIWGKEFDRKDPMHFTWGW